MRKTLHLFYAMLAFANMHAQSHYCADYKAQRFNKQMAILQSAKKTSSSQSALAPLENKYDLKFYQSITV